MDKNEKFGEMEFILTLCSLAKYLLIPMLAFFAIAEIFLWGFTSLSSETEIMELSARIALNLTGAVLIIAQAVDIVSESVKWIRKHKVTVKVIQRKTDN